MNELRHIAAGLLIGIFVLLLGAVYWSVIRADDLTARADNPRLVEAEAVIQRGNIYDRSGFLLATTTSSYNNIGQRRLYPIPETAPVVGYYSMRYGTDGIETSFDALLSGELGPTPFDEARRQLYHAPAIGGDIRLTLDRVVQQDAVDAMHDYSGAVMVASVPDGAILAMASAPTYNPNYLDENWPTLIQRTDAPLLNRATQGVYQPGGILQTAYIANALSTGTSINTVIAGAADTITINGITLTCLTEPIDNETMTLGEAYIYGCPNAFVEAGLDSPEAYDQALWRFGLVTMPELPDLAVNIANSPIAIAQEAATEDAIAAISGQGPLTITPLQLLELIGAIANEGNIPLYTITESYRLPEDEAWQAIPEGRLSRALLTAQNAEVIQALMQLSATTGTTAAIQEMSNYPIIGHAATAFVGPEITPIQWFMGMVTLEDGTDLVTVVVLEDAPSTSDAVRTGVEALESAITSQ